MKPLTPDTIRRRIGELDRQHREAWKRWLGERDTLANEKAALQERCPHEWKFASDPAGGSDSGYTCNVCGAESKTGPLNISPRMARHVAELARKGGG